MALSLNKILTQVAALGGGSPPAGYEAEGVNFDGATQLGVASLVSPNDSRYYTCSFWKRTVFPMPQTGIVFAANPDVFWVAGYVGAGNDHIFYAGDGASGNGNILSAAGPTDGLWHHFLLTIDAVGGTVSLLYIDDELALSDSSGSPTSFAEFNGFPMLIGAWGPGGDPLIGDLADLWIAPGVNLVVDGVIPEATRRKFITADLRPVDLGADGSVPTGSPPPVFFKGGPSGWATNAGSGGAFTITGTLTPSSDNP